jgi:predicted phosphodiesterase
MTRILTFSDIHGAVPAVVALVEAEPHNFDAVVVVGDIGPRPIEFFRALELLSCPAFYVYGNWDGHLSYEHVFNKRFVHLHGAVASVGELQLVGFSGSGNQWGQNPLWRKHLDEVEYTHRAVLERLAAARIADQKAGSETEDRATRVRETRAFDKYAAAWRAAWKMTSERNRVELAERVRESHCHPSRFVLITHERLPRLQQELPGLGAHLFGHRHGFKVTKQRGTIFANVSSLDPWSTQRGAQYGVIEWTVSSGFRVFEKRLPRTEALRVQCMEYRNTPGSATAIKEPAGLILSIARGPLW